LDYDALFPGRFLKASVLQGRDVTLEIADVRIEELPAETGGTKVKGIIAFKGKKMELVLNRTNGESIKAMFGRDTGEWIGKRITLFPTEWNGEPCIRVKGSPDIAAPVKFELKLPRKKPKATTMLVTGKAASGAPTQPTVPASSSPDEVAEVLEEARQHDNAEVPGF
jgi:hypothetical protein